MAQEKENGVQIKIFSKTKISSVYSGGPGGSFTNIQTVITLL